MRVGDLVVRNDAPKGPQTIYIIEEISASGNVARCWVRYWHTKRQYFSRNAEINLKKRNYLIERLAPVPVSLIFTPDIIAMSRAILQTPATEDTVYRREMNENGIETNRPVGTWGAGRPNINVTR